MGFVNQVEIPEQSVQEKIPIMVEWDDVSQNLANSVLVAHRTDMSNLHKDKVNISSIVHMSGNKVFIEDFFKGAEDKEEGRYAVTIVVRDVEPPLTELEVNLIGDVIRAI